MAAEVETALTARITATDFLCWREVAVLDVGAREARRFALEDALSRVRKDGELNALTRGVLLKAVEKFAQPLRKKRAIVYCKTARACCAAWRCGGTVVACPSQCGMRVCV